MQRGHVIRRISAFATGAVPRNWQPPGRKALRPGLGAALERPIHRLSARNPSYAFDRKGGYARRLRSMSTSRISPDMDKQAINLIPLEREIRAVLPTPEAALHLNRAQQTLRLWAMRENGPIRPLRVNGRLAWPVAELRKLLHVQEAR